MADNNGITSRARERMAQLFKFKPHDDQGELVRRSRGLHSVRDAIRAREAHALVWVNLATLGIHGAGIEPPHVEDELRASHIAAAQLRPQLSGESENKHAPPPHPKDPTEELIGRRRDDHTVTNENDVDGLPESGPTAEMHERLYESEWSMHGPPGNTPTQTGVRDRSPKHQRWSIINEVEAMQLFMNANLPIYNNARQHRWDVENGWTEDTPVFDEIAHSYPEGPRLPPTDLQTFDELAAGWDIDGPEVDLGFSW